ncbi:MAG: glycosyltransferase family 4 protein [Deltaproteobacteria bacterium]|nr:glycosyltransferase family 4 protein [Deltaproteobacteria bacterium]
MTARNTQYTTVGRMRVLFASGIDGFCHRYGVLHWAEELAAQDVASTTRAHSDPRLAADLAVHDVLVLYRVPDGAWVRHLLARARALGRATVFAADDLIFDPALTDPPPVRRMDAAERRLWRDGVERYHRTLLACDAVLATSEPLAAAGRAAGRRVYLHRCSLAERELAIGAAAAITVRRAARDRTHRAGSTQPAVRLGYFSGTATHDEDFASIASVLRTLLAQHPTLTLVVAGPVRLDPALAAFTARIERQPLVAWPELPARLAGVDVNLAPLVWRDPFVAAKGAVKYLEAAAVGVPTVASPTEAFRHAIRDGETGLLAADTASWEAALTNLLEDAPRRLRLGAAARADVVGRFAAAAQGRELHAILADVVERMARPSTPADRAVPVAPRSADTLTDAEHRVDASVADEVALARRFPGEVARAAREPNAFPDLTLPAAATTAPLGDGVLLAQRFRARLPGLTRVDVHTVTYGLPLDHVLEFCLRRTDGSLVGDTRVPAALAPDRDWLALELAPEADSADRMYVLELRAHGTGTRNALSFGTTTVPHEDGEYHLGGTVGAGSLALRTFALGAAGAHPA